MTAPSSPAAESDHKRAWRALVDRVKGGEAALGERLYLLGAGPVPVDGAVGGALTLDEDGGVVLVTGLAEPSEPAASQIARQLEAVGRLPGASLREAGVDPSEGGGLAQRHAAFFELSGPAELNTRQRCIVVLGAEPAASDREALEAGLGDSLAGLLVATEAGVAPVAEPSEAAEPGAEAAAPEPEIVLEPEGPAPAEEAPVEEAPVEEVPGAEAEVEIEAEAEAEVAPEADAEAEPEGPAGIEADLDGAEAADGERSATIVIEDRGQAAEADAEAGPDLVAPYLADETTTVIVEEGDDAAAGELVEPGGRFAGWPIGNWIGLTMILVGLTIGVVGVLNLRKGDTDEAPPDAEKNDLITTVAGGVTQDATHARWIGQQRVVTLSDGTLVFVYPTEGSLNFVKDGADVGETWGEPFALEDVPDAKSLSLDVDSKDRLHVAYSDGASINYVRLKDKPAGWKPSRIVQLDDDTTSLHVDLAWDERSQTAHVVWVQQNDEGEAPAWAALTSEGGIHLAEEGILTQAGQDVPVLVSVAADARSSLLVAYRHGAQLEGWSTRYSPGPSPDGTWLFEEEEQVPLPGYAGAGDVVYDRQKTAHLVLRDDETYILVYFRKTQGGPWSEGETVHEGADVDGVEFPALSYNSGDDNLYLFFQSNQYYAPGQILYRVRSLTAEGWEGPYEIMTAADAPDGALYPVTPERVTAQAIAFWTKTGDPYVVESAPVAAPSEAEDDA
ncbi:MAG: hypothetical protein M3279_06450 [Actinomycetota bacterium]|nr:hypothetical protein [Actinomycetota bacterium]